MFGYRVGYPGELDAAEALNFEYEELQNDHTLDDVAAFLKVSPRWGWRRVLAVFKKQHPGVVGVWLTTKANDALYYYGHPGEDQYMYRVKYDPKNIVIDLGRDGIFVLYPGPIQDYKYPGKYTGEYTHQNPVTPYYRRESTLPYGIFRALGIYRAIATNSASVPQSWVDGLFYTIKNGLGHMIGTWDLQRKYWDLEASFAERKWDQRAAWSISEKMSGLIDIAISLREQFNRAYTRSDKIIAIDAFMHAQHMNGPFLTRLYEKELTSNDSASINKEVNRELNKLFKGKRNPTRSTLAPAVADTIATLKKAPLVKRIYGTGSYFRAKVRPGDADFIVQLKIPFQRGYDADLMLLDHLIDALKSRHVDAKGIPRINIFLEDSTGKALNSAWLWWRWDQDLSWYRLLEMSYEKGGGGAGEWQSRWKRTAL